MWAEIVWTPQSREDLLDIYLVIGLDNRDAAERFYAVIESKASLLARNPRIGVRRPEIHPSARMLVVGSYLVLYQTHPDRDDGEISKVEVVRVVDGRRDLVSLFDPDDRASFYRDFETDV